MLTVASIEVNACSHSIVHPAVLKVQGLGGVVYFSVSKYRSFLFIEDVRVWLLRYIFLFTPMSQIMLPKKRIGYVIKPSSVVGMQVIFILGHWVDSKF